MRGAFLHIWPLRSDERGFFAYPAFGLMRGLYKTKCPPPIARGAGTFAFNYDAVRLWIDETTIVNTHRYSVLVCLTPDLRWDDIGGHVTG